MAPHPQFFEKCASVGGHPAGENPQKALRVGHKLFGCKG
jgi:hypothetical protein